jgi:hypothetical protein
MKGPNVAHCDGVRKHRAVAVQLKSVEERDDRECDGPAQAGANDQKPERTVIEAQCPAGHLNDCPCQA